MKNYKKIYLKSLNKDETDFLPSEISGAKAVDIHHIKCKGMGGNPKKNKDRIENLIALTREEHLKYGDKTKYMHFLYVTHLKFLEVNNITFDKSYIKEKINIYKAN